MKSHGVALATRARHPAVLGGRRFTGANLTPERRPSLSMRHADTATGISIKNAYGQAKSIQCISKRLKNETFLSAIYKL
jgi:hypothetical protein